MSATSPPPAADADRDSPDAPRRGTRPLALLLGAGLLGCVSSLGEGPAGEDPAAPATLAAMASGAEGGANPDRQAQLVPVGRDPDGCLMYRIDAPDRLTIQAITYRRPDGGFTFDRRQADCALATQDRTEMPASGRK